MGMAQAQTDTETVLHNFAGLTRGAHPYGGVIRDPSGNLYGTTYSGGKSNAGVVFKVNTAGQETVLYSFTGGADGENPDGSLILDSAGSLYGTTYNGGTARLGVVFKISPSGQETVLYSFCNLTGCPDGAIPHGGVIRDASGNLYGTTQGGGTVDCGVVYKLSAAGEEAALYSFTGGIDGAFPYAGVILDSAGNLYGTTLEGGAGGVGAVFEVSPSGQETVLYSFTGGTDGGQPQAGVIRDSAGNLYALPTLAEPRAKAWCTS